MDNDSFNATIETHHYDPTTVGRRKHRKNSDVIFKDGVVDGCVFGVVEAFREQLDIKWDNYRGAWIQSPLPLFRFDVGHIFHNPPHARNSNHALQQTAQVSEARSDEMPKSGWVKFKLCRLENGKDIGSCSHNLPQVEFVKFLQTGQLPAGHEICSPPNGCGANSASLICYY